MYTQLHGHDGAKWCGVQARASLQDGGYRMIRASTSILFCMRCFTSFTRLSHRFSCPVLLVRALAVLPTAIRRKPDLLVLCAHLRPQYTLRRRAPLSQWMNGVRCGVVARALPRRGGNNGRQGDSRQIHRMWRHTRTALPRRASRSRNRYINMLV